MNAATPAGAGVGQTVGETDTSLTPPADACSLCPICACHAWCEVKDAIGGGSDG